MTPASQPGAVVVVQEQIKRPRQHGSTCRSHDHEYVELIDIASSAYQKFSRLLCFLPSIYHVLVAPLPYYKTRKRCLEVRYDPLQK
jgi:hypothetical protein